MINQMQKSLQEAATNVINRRLNIDDILYFVTNIMQPDRYAYMLGTPGFAQGYNEAKQKFNQAVVASTEVGATQPGDNQITRIRDQVESIADADIGQDRYSTMMDCYWTKGYAYAYQEFTRFLEADFQFSNPDQEPTHGRTV